MVEPSCMRSVQVNLGQGGDHRDALRVDLPPDSKALDLKVKIEGQNTLLVPFQHLVSVRLQEEVEDDQPVNEERYYLSAALPARAKGVITPETIANFEQMEKLWNKGESGSRPGESSTSDKRDVEIKELQAKILSDIAAKGDHLAINSLLGLLKDRSTNVRLSAVLALARLAKRGDGRVLEALTSCLNDTHHVNVGPAALKALALLAHMDDRTVIDSLIACITCAGPNELYMRATAVESLPGVVKQAASYVISELAPVVQNSKAEKEVRMAALKSMAVVADKDHAGVIALLVDCIRCADPEESDMRKAAVEWLPHVVEKSTDNVLEQLTIVLEWSDADKEVIRAVRDAAKALRDAQRDRVMVSASE